MDYPGLEKNLLEAIKEFSEVFAVDSLTVKSRTWAESIRRDHNRVATLPAGPGRNLIWTKERGKRKIVLQTSGSRLDIGDKFKAWLEMPWTSKLVRRGIAISTSPWTTSPNEVAQGADDDMLPP